MLAVQTLNLHNYYNNDDKYTIKLQIIMSLISSYLLRKHYDRVILYCDKRTAEILADSYYTEIRVLPNNIFGKYNYGTLAKLYTYSNIEEEYIHFDIDYFLFNKIELKDNIICSYSETPKKLTESVYNETYIGLIDILKENYKEFKFPFNVIDKTYAMNMCVFGIPNKYHKNVTDYFKELNEYTETHIENIFNSHLVNKPPHWAIEQYLPAQFFLENKFDIKELNQFENYQIRRNIDSIRLYHMENFSLVGTARIKDVNIKDVLTKYMMENIGHHLWVSKSVAALDELLIDTTKEMFIELYEKINFILNKHIIQNKRTIRLL